MTLKGLDWFEVTEARGVIQYGKVAQYHVKMKVGFRLMREVDLETKAELKTYNHVGLSLGEMTVH